MPEEAREQIRQEKEEKKRKSGLEAKLGETELAEIICRVYNLAVRFYFHDDIRFEPSDCKDEAEGLSALINRFPKARIILRLIMPLGALAAMVEKVETLFQRKSARDVQSQAGSNQPA